MYYYFFYFLYSYYDSTKKWQEAKVPYLSSILVISVLQMFNYIFIRDLIMFHIRGVKYESFAYENLIVPSIFIVLNYLYFNYNSRSKKILKQFGKRTKEDKRPYWIFSWIYIIVTVILVIAMGYSVRNNIRWF